MQIFSPYYLFLFTFLSIIFSSNRAANTQNLIPNICSKTLNSTYCLQFLRPLYRSGESIQDLAEDTIDSSSTFVFLIYDEIHAREIQSSKNPGLNNIYHKCGVQYAAATNALLGGKNAVGSDDYKNLSSLAASALKAAQNCELSFGGEASEPANFKRLNEQGGYVCSIALAVANYLIQVSVVG